VNKGQVRGGFTVAIAGSNGYVTTQLATPAGFRTGVPFGKFAINAPYDAQGYNTYMGAKMFTGVWNVDQCSQYCDAQTKYNLATAPSDGTPAKVCKFFNTYLLTAKIDGKIVPQGQYCSLYTEAWPIKYATNGGQMRDKDQYTVDYSFGYSKIASSSDIDPLAGDVKGATYQAVADIKWSSLQPFCSAYLGYTTPLSTVTATATITPVSTSTAYSTTTVAAMRKRDDTNSAFPGLSTDSSVGAAVLVDGNNVTWYSGKIPAVGPLAHAGLSKRDVQVQVPADLAKYQSAVISAACSMQVKPASSTFVLTASATVTGPASITTTTLIATATAQNTGVDNLLMTISDQTRSPQGFPAGVSPIEFDVFTVSGTTYFDRYTFGNLRTEYSNYATKAHFDFDPTTGFLSTPANGGMIATAYAAYTTQTTYSFVYWQSAAELAQDSHYAPLVCSRSRSGQLSCSLTSTADSTVKFSQLFAQGYDGVLYMYLTIGGAQVEPQNYLYPATLSI